MPVDSQDAAITLATARRMTADGTARRLREANRLSLGDMARAVGTSPSTIWRWEQGRGPTGEIGLRYGELLARLAVLAPGRG